MLALLSGGRSEVALLAEGVDRNGYYNGRKVIPIVALLAEGVDRNSISTSSVRSTPVALLAEGVDRNTVTIRKEATAAGRPPRGGRG